MGRKPDVELQAREARIHHITLESIVRFFPCRRRGQVGVVVYERQNPSSIIPRTRTKNFHPPKSTFEIIIHRSHNFILAQSKTQIVQAKHLTISDPFVSFLSSF